mmetsp:Transcript_24977/g.57721  ORF Transcript_24977/g.57721 Transcript_24977/m.57721 type:complete len:311 (-) Transcript_24977:114-1046(-)
MTFSSALFSVSLSFLRSFTTFWSRFSAWARSARASSRLMTSASRTGSTEPSTWITFSSSKHRTTWTMASHCRMFPRNLLPRPSPEAAPFTRPAMSTNSRVEGMTWGRRILSARSSAVGFFERSRGDNFLRTYLHAFVDFFQDLEPRIGNFDDSDVRFDGAKRIIGGLRSLGLRQRVEKRRLRDAPSTTFVFRNERQKISCQRESRLPKRRRPRREDRRNSGSFTFPTFGRPTMAVFRPMCRTVPLRKVRRGCCRTADRVAVKVARPNFLPPSTTKAETAYREASIAARRGRERLCMGWLGKRVTEGVSRT